MPGETPAFDDPFVDAGGRTLDPFDPTLYPTQTSRRAFPWAILAISIGAVLLIAALAIGLSALVKSGVLVTERPETVVERYYAALQTADFQGMTACFDPQDASPDSLLPMAQKAVDGLNGLAVDTLKLNIKVRWELKDLTYTVVNQTKETAQVQVAGKLHIWEETSQLGLSPRHQETYEMVKRKGHWYIRP